MGQRMMMKSLCLSQGLKLRNQPQVYPLIFRSIGRPVFRSCTDSNENVCEKYAKMLKVLYQRNLDPFEIFFRVKS